MKTKNTKRSDNRLTSTLPPAYGDGWAAMRDLQLGNNSLEGPLPKEWARMARLETLYLT